MTEQCYRQAHYQSDMNDGDSVRIVSTLELEERQKHIKTYQFRHCVTKHEARLTLTIATAYIQKTCTPQNCFTHSFCLVFQEMNGCEKSKTLSKGNISILGSSLELLVSVELDNWKNDDYIWGKVRFFQEKQWRLKTYKMLKEGNSFGFTIKEQLNKYMSQQHMHIEITIQRELPRCSEFVGFQNEGNTCYMNSFLQILFFLRPLRKIIVESNSENATVKALKEVFIDLIYKEKSVDAQRLIKAFGRFSQYPRRQQDIHEFLIGFLDQLEGVFPEVKYLWLGNGQYITESKEPTLPYKSIQKDDFCELDVHMYDVKTNPLRNLQRSIKTLLQEQTITDPIDTDEYGKIRVAKHRRFQSLPYFIFFNVKRYTYCKETHRLKKILQIMNYPPQIDLGFLLQTPASDSAYILYALAVHKGNTPMSGHYYTVLNTSTDSNTPQWCEFNDSVVQLSSLEQALSYSGIKKKNLLFSTEYQRFIEEQHYSDETAYLLCYARKSTFNSLQSTPYTVPDKPSHSRIMDDEEENMQIDVCVLDTIKPQSLFDSVETMRFPMITDEDIYTQLKSIEQEYLGCEVGSIWKVSKGAKRVKRLVRLKENGITVQRVFGYKKGHNRPDYLLVVPKDIKTFPPTIKEGAKVGLILTQTNRHNYSCVLIDKSTTEQFITYQDERLLRKGEFERMEDFLIGINDLGILRYDG